MRRKYKVACGITSRERASRYLQANLEVGLTGTSDDVLSAIRDQSLRGQVGLREMLEPFDEFGEIASVIDLGKRMTQRTS